MADPATSMMPGTPLGVPTPGGLPETTKGILPATQAPPQVNWRTRSLLLQSEYVAGGGYTFLSQYIRSLPHHIDDATRDFGDDLYDRMMTDPQVSSGIRLLKEETMASGIRLEPAVQKEQMDRDLDDMPIRGDLPWIYADGRYQALTSYDAKRKEQQKQQEQQQQQQMAAQQAAQQQAMMPGQMPGMPPVPGQPPMPGQPPVPGQQVPGQPGMPPGHPGMPGQPPMPGHPGMPPGHPGQPPAPGQPPGHPMPLVPGQPPAPGQPPMPGMPPGPPAPPGAEGEQLPDVDPEEMLRLQEEEEELKRLTEEAELAAEITEFCEENLRQLDRPFVETMYEMLDAIAVGNRVAEQVYKVRKDEKDVPRMFLRALKTKPRRSVAFVVDPYNNVVGVLGLIPGQAYPVLTGSVVAQPEQVPNMMHRSKFAIFTWGSQSGDPRGQALDPETYIPTPDGWKKLDEIQVGSKVFDEEGKIRYVVARKDWMDRPCYKLTFRDNHTIVADENHLWVTENLHERHGHKGGKVRTTTEIASSLKDTRGATNHGIPWHKPLEYNEQILPVDPYYLGYWLGNGDSGTASLASHAKDAEEVAGYIRICGYDTKICQNGTAGCQGRQIWVRSKEKLWSSRGPSHFLRSLGVKNNKHIPECYMRGSKEQRLQLLRGLMDSDGYVDKDGRCEFNNTNPNLISGVAELVRSLGVGATVRKRRNAGPKNKDAWSVFFTPDFSPFRLKRKAELVRASRGQRYHYITGAEKVANRRTVCIEVDSPSHMFLAGQGMVPTHNSLLRCIYNPWVLKQQAWGEFAKYLVKFATPSLVGYTAPMAQMMPPTDHLGNPIPGVPWISPEQSMLNALLSFTNGSAVVFPNGSNVQPLNMGGDGSVYRNAIDMFDKQIAKGIMCQTLATEEGLHQARAASEIHQDVLDVVVLHIKNLLAEMIYRDILMPLVTYNWGADIARRLCPRVHLSNIQQHNWAKDAGAVASLMSSKYLSPSQMPEMDARLGLPRRSKKDMEDLKNPPAPPGGPGGPPPGPPPGPPMMGMPPGMPPKEGPPTDDPNSQVPDLQAMLENMKGKGGPPADAGKPKGKVPPQFAKKGKKVAFRVASWYRRPGKLRHSDNVTFTGSEEERYVIR